MIVSLLLALGFAPVTLDASLATPAAVVAPQDFPASRGSSSPSGGTPEPTSMLLLAGGAVGYGMYRLARAKKQGSQEN
jgi:hypothetical protein